MRNGNDHGIALYKEIRIVKGDDTERVYECLESLATEIDRAAELMKDPETSLQATKDYHLAMSIFFPHVAALKRADRDIKGLIEALDRAGSAREQFERLRSW